MISFGWNITHHVHLIPQIKRPAIFNFIVEVSYYSTILHHGRLTLDIVKRPPFITRKGVAVLSFVLTWRSKVSCIFSIILHLFNAWRDYVVYALVSYVCLKDRTFKERSDRFTQHSTVLFTLLRNGFKFI